jgi:hypothetical protein
MQYEQKHNWTVQQAEKLEKQPSIEKNSGFSIQNSPLNQLLRIDKIPENHEAVLCCINRKINPLFWDKLYFSPNFKKWVNDFVEPGKFEHTDLPDPRLVIPFFTDKNEDYAYQGRALGGNEPRYITISPVKTNKLIYGLERFDKSKTGYIVEGPIDSLMISNCLAGASSKLERFNEFDNVVFIWDNEPRSEEICKIMNAAIEHKKKMVIWDDTFGGLKDLNAIVCAGTTQEQLEDYLRKRSFTGLECMIEFKRWKKI